jgi:hypothetical protein
VQRNALTPNGRNGIALREGSYESKPPRVFLLRWSAMSLPARWELICRSSDEPMQRADSLYIVWTAAGR